MIARLEWEEKAGDIRWLIHDGHKRGRTPAAEHLHFLANPPAHDAGIAMMARAYLRLTSERHALVFVRSDKHGNVGSQSIPSAIPWRAMLRWCRWNRLDRDVTDHVIAVLEIVDQKIRKTAIDRVKQQGR